MTLPVTTTMDGNISQDFLQVLPKVSARYQCTPETFTYLSVAKGYKTGGYNVQMFGDLVQAQAKYDLMSKFAPRQGRTAGRSERHRFLQTGTQLELRSRHPQRTGPGQAECGTDLLLHGHPRPPTHQLCRERQRAHDHQRRKGEQLWRGTEPAQPYHGRTHRRPQLRFYLCHFPRLHLHGQGREQPDRENGLQG